MRVLRGRYVLRRLPRNAVVSVGVYDGVHRAHQRIIATVAREARRLRAPSVVVTFDPDPERVLHPKRPPADLMPLEERLKMIAGLGVDCAWVIRFTRHFAKTSAVEFSKTVLIEGMRARCLIMGKTFMFGRNRRGDMTTLKTLGGPHGMRVISVAPIKRAGSRVSSSRIRRLIQQGRLTQAEELLGRPAALYGTVVRGSGRGRKLGFPTANLKLHSHVLPPPGVYAVRAKIKKRLRPGVMNLGRRPTFGGGPLVCEVHLLDFTQTLRSQKLCVELKTRLRGERTFAGPVALTRQIKRDIARARRLSK